MSISKKIALISLMITGSFYAESAEKNKSLTFIQFMKTEAVSLVSGAVVVASAYGFDKKMGILMTGAYALCAYRLFVDKKNEYQQKQKDTKKSE